MVGINNPSVKAFAGGALLAALALALPSVAAQPSATPYELEVCPDEKWHDAPFLKGPTSDETFNNATKWKAEQVTSYIQDSIFPQLRPNIGFVVIALIALVVFLLWRLFRRCCMCCCMRHSCEASRASADPKQVLSGWGFWILKVVVLLVAFTAFVMMLAGMATAKKALLVHLWSPVNDFSNYLDGMADSMDVLVDGLDAVDPILNNLTAIANNDVNFTYLRTNLQRVSVFLDLPAANPNAINTALVALDGSVTAVRAQLATLRAQAVALQPNAAALATGVSGLSTAFLTFSGYGTKLLALETALASLTSASGPSFSTSALSTAMTDVDLATWRPAVNAMIGALDAWKALKSGSSLGSLATAATAVNTAFNDLKNAKAPAAASSITAFFAAWNNASPAFANLLARVDSIQANVVVLDAATNLSIARFRTIYANVTSLLARTPTPATLASDLLALSAELSLGGVSDLIADLNSAQSKLDAVPDSSLDGARAAIVALKTALDALSPKKDATATALATYSAASTQANFDALKASAAGAGNTAALTTTARTAATAASVDLGVTAVQTAIIVGGLVSITANIKTNLDALVSNIDTALSRISQRVPTLAPYTSLTTSVLTVYNTLPTPKSLEVASVQRTLDSIERDMLTTPATVRSDVTRVQADFGDGVNSLRNDVIAKIEKFENNRTETVANIDKARYEAIIVPYIVATIFLIALMVFVCINLPFGIAFCIFFLLLLAILMFLIAVIFAALLALAQDGCHHSEHIVLQAAGSDSTIEPLLNYYFFGDNSTSVRLVLKQADLVDVDKVTNDVTRKVDDIINSITSKYTPRPKLQAIFDDTRAFVNVTLVRIDGVLNRAGVWNVRPLYVGVKSFPCCEVAGYSGTMWVVLTFGGWLLLVTCGLAMTFLGRLDRLPQSGPCGCKPLLLSRLQGSQVYPEGGGGGGGGGEGYDKQGGGYGGGDEEHGGVLKAVVLTAPPAVVVAGGASAYPPVDPYGGGAPPPPPYGTYPPPGVASGPPSTLDPVAPPPPPPHDSAPAAAAAEPPPPPAVVGMQPMAHGAPPPEDQVNAWGAPSMVRAEHGHEGGGEPPAMVVPMAPAQSASPPRTPPPPPVAPPP